MKKTELDELLLKAQREILAIPSLYDEETRKIVVKNLINKIIKTNPNIFELHLVRLGNRTTIKSINNAKTSFNTQDISDMERARSYSFIVNLKENELRQTIKFIDYSLDFFDRLCHRFNYSFELKKRKNHD